MEEVSEEGHLQIDEEERQMIIAFRKKKGLIVDSSPAGIGTGNIWAKAKINKKHFIDDCTFIEKESNTR